MRVMMSFLILLGNFIRAEDLTNLKIEEVSAETEIVDGEHKNCKIEDLNLDSLKLKFNCGIEPGSKHLECRSECQEQVQGFKGAKFQKFQALQDAEHFVSSSTNTAAQIKVSSSSLVISYETPPSSSTPSPNPSPTKRAGPNAKTYYAVAKGKTVGIFLTW